MLFDRPETGYEVSMIPSLSTRVLVKSAAVDTCKRYEVAPSEAFHVNVGATETPDELFDGVASTGADGGGK